MNTTNNNAEHDEAQKEIDDARKLQVRANEAHVMHTEAAGSLLVGKAHLFGALAFVAGIAPFIVIAWSVWWWAK